MAGRVAKFGPFICGSCIYGQHQVCSQTLTIPCDCERDGHRDTVALLQKRTAYWKIPVQ